jgi:hypothetical protein
MSRIYLLFILVSIHFAVNAQSISSVVPNEAEQGDELEVTVTGENTNWTQSTNLLMFKQGSTTLYPGPQTIINDSLITGYFYFYFSHPTGPYDVIVEDVNTGVEVTLENGFTLNEGDEPVIQSVVPDSAHQATYVTVTVTGEHTHFTQGSSLLMFHGDYDLIYPNTQVVYSDTVMDGSFFINPDHEAGAYDVKVFSEDPLMTLPDGFNVLPAENLPVLVSVDPDTVEQGVSETLLISGQYTHFNYPELNLDVKLVSQNQTLLANEVSVLDSVQLEATFSFGYGHPPGNYDLWVYNELDGTMVLDQVFVLEEGPDGPEIASVDPDNAEQEQSLWITITGQNTSFTSGTATISFKQGSSTIYPSEQLVLNDTVIEGDFDFSIEHPEGYYDVLVYDQNGSWSLNAENGFYLYPFVFVEEFPEAALGHVYPNPATQLLFIKKNPSIKSGMAIDILNMAGEIVYLDELTANHHIKSIDVSNIESGVYLVHLRSAGQVFIEKIVIK